MIVADNSQVASNTISGHKPPSGDHSNLIRGSVNGTDLSENLKASLRLHCPSGLQRTADICFETSLRSGDYAQALKTCAAAGLRVPSDAELALVFNASGAPQAEKWVTSRYVTQTPSGPVRNANALAEDSSRNLFLDSKDAMLSGSYRCVTSATN